VVVEQRGELVPVVPLHGSLSESIADDTFANRERLHALLAALAAVVSLSQFPQGPEYLWPKYDNRNERRQPATGSAAVAVNAMRRGTRSASACAPSRM
jgi:hypothetical protein